MKPRPGLPSDVDAVTKVLIKTMPLDPQWNYRFPLRREYPEDHYKYHRMLIEYFLDPSYDDWQVMVIEDSLDPTASASEKSIVAFGVWDVSYANKRKYGPGYKTQDRKSRPSCPTKVANPARTPNTDYSVAVTQVEEHGGSTRRDANHEHFNAFWKGQIRAYKRYFGRLGPEKLHLQILATLPAYQRRGHGSSICKWGMELVRRDSLNSISVMASPMGCELYTWLGFAKVGTFYIQAAGEEEKLTLEAMLYCKSIM